MFTKTYDWESHESFEELLKSKIISISWLHLLLLDGSNIYKITSLTMTCIFLNFRILGNNLSKSSSSAVSSSTSTWSTFFSNVLSSSDESDSSDDDDNDNDD